MLDSVLLIMGSGVFIHLSQGSLPRRTADVITLKEHGIIGQVEQGSGRFGQSCLDHHRHIITHL